MTDLSILFWTKVSRPSPAECWEWLAACTPNGTGVMTIWLDGKWRTRAASHIAVYLMYGYWPVRRLPRLCETPTCVNPKHFKLD